MCPIFDSSQCVSYQKSFEDIHLNIKIYWISPALPWNSRTVVTLTCAHQLNCMMMSLSFADDFPQWSNIFFLFLICSSIHIQCFRNTFVQGSGISFIGIFSQFGKIQKTEHAFVKKIKNPNLELPQTQCPAAKNFYIFYELEET